jgi:hypothetical protein
MRTLELMGAHDPRPVGLRPQPHVAGPAAWLLSHLLTPHPDIATLHSRSRRSLANNMVHVVGLLP